MRKLIELPYHAKEIGDVPRLVNILCDTQFIDAVFRSRHFELLQYYSLTAGMIPL